MIFRQKNPRKRKFPGQDCDFYLTSFGLGFFLEIRNKMAAAKTQVQGERRCISWTQTFPPGPACTNPGILARALGLACAFWLAGCAQTASERMEEERSKVRAHPAAFAADSFYLGTGEDRKPNSQDGSSKKFYFKDCELVSRKRFPVRAEYECNRE